MGGFRAQNLTKSGRQALCRSAGTRQLGAVGGAVGRFLVTSTKGQHLVNAYCFPGFEPTNEVRIVFGDFPSRITNLGDAIICTLSTRRFGPAIDDNSISSRLEIQQTSPM